MNIADAGFEKLLRERTSPVVRGKPRGLCDIVFVGLGTKSDLERLRQLKTWIEPNGAIWGIRVKGPAAPLKDTDLIDAGLAAGLVDNKIASFSDTKGAMRWVF
ncbi:MAG TPA: hypothetical protein VHO95_03175, partial [Candidatus Dormibacteraeota bacterium]|nr:hypothetical protein [Candidatus Dormibacteraeota bacterium]